MENNKIKEMSWSEVEKTLTQMRTVTALDLFFKNEVLNDAQKGCLLYRVMSNERFSSKEEFERFTGIPKGKIITLMRKAEDNYNAYLLTNKEELYNIRTIKDRMKKLKDIPFEELPRPFKKIDEFLELIPSMTAEEIWKELNGNINLNKAEEGLCIYYLAKLEKTDGLSIFINEHLTQNKVYTRLQQLKKVYGQDLLAQFLDHYKEMTNEELLNELKYNVLLQRKEHGLIYLQLMKNYRFDLQKELIEKFGFSTVTVSVAIKEARKNYKDLTLV